MLEKWFRVNQKLLLEFKVRYDIYLCIMTLDILKRQTRLFCKSVLYNSYHLLEIKIKFVFYREKRLEGY